MKNKGVLMVMAIVVMVPAAKAEGISRGLPAFTLPSVQLERIKSEISDNVYSENPPRPAAVPGRTFKDAYDFRVISRGGNAFSPVSDLRKLKAILKALPGYLNGANLGFEAQKGVLESIANGERNLDAMLLKYSNSGTSTTRGGFLIEAGPAMRSFERVFLALKGNNNGGSQNDNCWSNCVEDCDPTDIGGIVCHVSCFYTCETTK